MIIAPILDSVGTRVPGAARGPTPARAEWRANEDQLPRSLLPETVRAIHLPGTQTLPVLAYFPPSADPVSNY